MSDNTQVSNEEILRALKLLENTLRGNQTTMMAAAKSTPLAATSESRYNYTELSDADGNVVYPHSGAAVIWMQDGTNVQQVLGRLAKILESIDGISSVTNLDDDTKLATAKAVASLNDILDTLNRNLTANGAVKKYEVVSGDGLYVSYQDGEETVKKKLGDPVYTTRTIASGRNFTYRDHGASAVTSVAIPQYDNEKVVAVYLNNINASNDATALQYGRFSHKINGNNLEVTVTMNSNAGGSTFSADIIGIYAKV